MNERTTRNSATAAPVARASRMATPRGPRRSARCPSGTPAIDPIAQPRVSPNPTWVGERPTMRVKYSAEQT